MTRILAKSQKLAVNPSSSPTTSARDSNMSESQPQSTATPSPIAIRTSHPTQCKSDSNSPRDDASPSLVQDAKSEHPAPEPSQPPKDFSHPESRPTPPSHDSLKVPSLAHKARLRVHFEDLTHPAVAKFLSVMPISTLLQTAISNVQKHLFTSPAKHHNPSEASNNPPRTTPNPTTTFFTPKIAATSLAIRPPPQNPITPPQEWIPQEVRSVTLIVRSMDGVAYTTGTDLDSAHKEIHLSIGYIEHTMDSNKDKPEGDELFKYELMGVLTHEMVHAFQHNAHSSCPGGLIEGIADYVRLKSDLGAKHWNPWPADKKSRGEKWDEGYQKTAWFLTWVEKQAGKDVIGRLNFEMRKKKWDEGSVWKDVVGESVKDMWERYESSWEEMNRKHEKDEKSEEMTVMANAKGVWL